MLGLTLFFTLSNDLLKMDVANSYWHRKVFMYNKLLLVKSNCNILEWFRWCYIL